MLVGRKRTEKAQRAVLPLQSIYLTRKCQKLTFYVDIFFFTVSAGFIPRHVLIEVLRVPEFDQL